RTGHMFADSSSSGPIFGKNPSTYSRRDARRARKRGGPSAESCVRCLLLFSRTTDYTENRYLMNSWELVTARIFPLLTQRILRCLNGSDFTAVDIIAGKKPVTVYLCIPEEDLEAKSAVIRLVME